MEKFSTLEEAVELASTRCVSWTDATSADNRYSADDMTGIAEAADSEDPLDEDGFYVVSPAGAIGISGDGDDINWIFISDNAPGEDLPAQTPQINFCPKCGQPVDPGSHFCSKCGGQLK